MLGQVTDEESAMAKEIEHWVVPEHGRGRLRPFLPGTSGNPKGRASGTSFAEVVRLARRNSVEAMQVLIDIALDPQEDARSRIVACQAILDRAFGKVSDKPPPVDTGDPVTLDASRLTDKELKALLKLLDIFLKMQIGRRNMKAPAVNAAGYIVKAGVNIRSKFSQGRLKLLRVIVLRTMLHG